MSRSKRENFNIRLIDVIPDPRPIEHPSKIKEIY